MNMLNNNSNSTASNPGTVALFNGSAQLEDYGNGVAVLRLLTKMNTCDDGVFDLVERAIDFIPGRFKAMAILSSHAKVFSAGANVGVFISLLRGGDEAGFRNFVRRGQLAWYNLRRAPFPVVAAVDGLAIGGGSELLLGCDRIVTGPGFRMGFPERRVGIIPGWGGTTRMLWCWQQAIADPIEAAAGALKMIGRAAIDIDSAAAMRDHFLTPTAVLSAEGISMNETAFAEAKRLASEYVPPSPISIRLVGAGAYDRLIECIEADEALLALRRNADDYAILEELASLFCGNDACLIDEQEMLQRECQSVLRLAGRPATVARMEGIRNSA